MKPSCFKKKLDTEACYHTCPVSDECYGETSSRNNVLDEVLEIVLKEPDYIAKNDEYRRGYVKAVNQMKIEIESLRR